MGEVNWEAYFWMAVLIGVLLWLVWDFIIDRPTNYQRKMREQIKEAFKEQDQ